jgi:DNA-binding MarR family transcriptional regulator
MEYTIFIQTSFNILTVKVLNYLERSGIMKNEALIFHFMADIMDVLNAYEDNSLKILSDINITLNEAKLLHTIFALRRDKRNTSSNIANVMKTTRAAVSMSIKILEKKDLVIREQDIYDRRVTYIEPTAKGNQIFKMYWDIHKDIITRSMSEFNAREKRDLMMLIASLRDQIKKITE